MNRPVHVYLDTSALRHENQRGGAGLERLKELATSRIVHVYVHELVKREFVTGLTESYREAIRRLEKDLRRAVSWAGVDGLASALDQLVRAKDTIDSAIEAGVDAWLRQLRIGVVPLRADMMTNVWERYFRGDPPFKASKSRGDIPDAFIFSGAIHLQRRLQQPVHVVVADGELRKAVDSQDGLIAHSDLGKLFVHDSVKYALRTPRTPEDEQHWLEKADRAMREQHSDVESHVVVSLEEELALLTLRHRDFPSDDRTATLVQAGIVANFDPIYDGLESFQANKALLPVWVSLSEAKATLHIAKVRYWSLPEEARSAYTLIDENYSTSHVEVGITINLRVLATVEVAFEQEEDTELLTVASAAIVDVDRVTVEMPDDYFA